MVGHQIASKHLVDANMLNGGNRRTILVMRKFTDKVDDMRAWLAVVRLLARVSSLTRTPPFYGPAWTDVGDMVHEQKPRSGVPFHSLRPGVAEDRGYDLSVAVTLKIILILTYTLSPLVMLPTRFFSEPLEYPTVKTVVGLEATPKARTTNCSKLISFSYQGFSRR